MHRLSEQTMGLVGFGNIARAVCEKAAGFGLEGLADDPFLAADEIREAGAEPVEDLDDLLARSDVVSVHTPLTPETRGLVGADLPRQYRTSRVGWRSGGPRSQRPAAECLRDPSNRARHAAEGSFNREVTVSTRHTDE